MGKIWAGEMLLSIGQVSACPRILSHVYIVNKERLVVKYCPWGKEKLYEKALSGFYLYNGGNTKDRLNACNAINIMFGKN